MPGANQYVLPAWSQSTPELSPAGTKIAPGGAVAGSVQDRASTYPGRGTSRRTGARTSRCGGRRRRVRWRRVRWRREVSGRSGKAGGRVVDRSRRRRTRTGDQGHAQKDCGSDTLGTPARRGQALHARASAAGSRTQRCRAAGVHHRVVGCEAIDPEELVDVQFWVEAELIGPPRGSPVCGVALRTRVHVTEDLRKGRGIPRLEQHAIDTVRDELRVTNRAPKPLMAPRRPSLRSRRGRSTPRTSTARRRHARSP